MPNFTTFPSPTLNNVTTNTVTLSGDATLPLQAVPLQQVTAITGGPYLPTGGGTMTGSLGYTATGGTTERSAQDRAADVVNVKDFGALGDGVTDDTASIQAALDAVTSNGGTVFLPAGTYLVSQTMFIKGNTSLLGAGAGSLITASPTWTIPGPDGSHGFFCNVNWFQNTIIDMNMMFENIQFTYVNWQRPITGQYAILIFNAENVIVRNCIFNYGDDGTYFLGCNNVVIDSCSAFHNTNCPYDSSFGPQNYRIVNCYAEMELPAQFVNFNGLGGGSLPLNRTASGLVVEGCRFICNASSAAINLDTLVETEHCTDVVIANNILSGGAWILAQGDIQNVVITGNVIIGTPPNGLPAIMVFPDGTNTPKNITVTDNIVIDAQTTAEFVAVIRVQADGYYIGGNTVTGTRFYSAVGTGANVGVVGPNNFAPGTGITQEGYAALSQTNDFQIGAEQAIGWYDLSGFLAKIITIGNGWNFYNTDSTGALYQLFGTTMHQDGGGLNVYGPSTFGQKLSNYGLCQGSPTGFNPSVSAVGTDINISMQLLGKGTGGGQVQGLSVGGPPVPTDIVPGCFTVASDGAGGFRLYYNNSGGLWSVALAP